MSTYGYAENVWSRAKAEAREALISCAKKGKDIVYSELTKQIRSITFQPNDMPFHQLLGQVSTDEHHAKRPLLSVLVVHKDGDRMPGPGFFQLAKNLGFSFDDTLTYWVEERKRVVEHWAP